MKRFISECQKWVETHSMVPLTVVRVYLGIGLFIKGIYFLQNRDVLDAILASASLPQVPFSVAQYIIGAHLVGGLLLVAGLFTRLAAFLQMPIFYGAIAYAYAGQMTTLEARQGFEFAGLMFFLSGLLVAFGGGDWSLDKMLLLRKRVSWTHNHPDAFLDLVRVFLGVALFLKAIFFMMHRDELIQVIERSGTWSIFPITLAHYVIPAHLVGGILLALGLLTRWAALAQLPMLIAAVFYVYMPNMLAIEGRQNFEFSSLVLFLLLLTAAFGAGKWSLEHVMSGDRDGEVQPKPAH
jgi:uncharacterized membrane protein YphA (DoxX/SURF4 family)